MTIIDRMHPVSVTLKERYLLTKEGSSKQTYHLVLDLKGSGVQFAVGDSIAIYACNDPRLVSHLLEAMHASGDEVINDPRSGTAISLRDFLSKKANLSRLTPSFLKLVHEYEPEHDKRNQIGHLLQKENKTRLSEYLSQHDPLDVLKEYKELKAPLQELCAQFGPLLPRFYSAASSLVAAPDEVHLTVALFTFSHSGEQRFGVASHFLCHMAEKGTTSIPVYVQPATGFTLPEDPTAPIIMIGPGTGVAPFRAFLQERAAKGAPGKNWLFFGECNRKSDFFYEEFWQQHVSRGSLRLDLAFSRDQPEKIYVQHRMLEAAADLWSWLQEGAILYVCGDAEHMAKDVEATLLQIFQSQGGHSPESAKEHLKSLRAQKRYLRDVY